MAVTQEHVADGTPMGAALAGGGATFRVWAPRAQRVFVVVGDETAAARTEGWTPRAEDALHPRGDGTWAGYVEGVRDGTPYRFFVVGPAGGALKRDPYARELGSIPGFPECDCLVRDPGSYPWHDGGFRTPEFRDLVIYQFHFGVFYAEDARGGDTREGRRAKFLDALGRIEYLRDLGVNAIQPLPIQEFPTEYSLGYNGTDYFSPESDYQVEDDAELGRYLAQANGMLARHGKPPLGLGQVRTGPDQLRLVVDLCHLNGIAVIFDVVYNHAGGGFDPASLYFLDNAHRGNNGDSLYFTSDGWAGGLVFAYWNAWVRQFLVDNASFLLREYHADGLRYDEVGVMDDHGGWSFCQDLAATVRFVKPEAIQIAEYWKEKRWLAVVPPPEGMGFDAALADRLRYAVRDAVEQASRGGGAHVDVERIAGALHPPYGFPAAWKAVQHVENHDLVRAGRDRRIASLADPADPRSWYARSRARVATGLVLTAPGIPMLFMGQEILEDKPWNDTPGGTLVWWGGLASDRAMRDHHAFTRDLVWLRRRLPALRAGGINVFHAWSPTRVLAFHRWVEGEGRDVVVVATFSESTHGGYRIGFPRPGRWTEAFNSDYYDNLPNPRVAGNAGGVHADGPPLHGLPHSAGVVIPANALLVFTHDG